ncbi:MAG: FAD synthase [Candidatus Diapherotrites archaeon]|nr:FAD synthase [Candidatus Diapherotrites archaeon]
MAFGTFDILHPGHLHCLAEAKSLGGENALLVVVVGRDSTVARLKGGKPVNDENSRLEVIRALRVVDEAVLGNEGDIYEIVRQRKPDVVALGYDQLADEKRLSSLFSGRIVRLKPFNEHIHKAGRIKERLAKKFHGNA